MTWVDKAVLAVVVLIAVVLVVGGHLDARRNRGGGSK